VLFMRLIRRLARILLFTLMLGIGVLVLALIATQTSWFKDWLRRYIVREASQVLNGDLTIGRLSGSLFFGIAMSDIALAQNGEKIIAIKDLHVDYSVFELISRGIAISEIELNQPVIVARRTPEGWNLARLVKHDRQEGPRRGPGRPVTIGRILIHDGTIGVDRGEGSAREDISKLDADFGFVYAPVRFTVDIGRLSLHSSNPALTLTQLSGSVTVAGDEIHINRLNTRLPQSDLRVDGVIHNYSKAAQFDLDVASSKLTFPEIGTLLPAVRHIQVQPAFTIKVTGPLSRLQSKLNLQSRDGGNVTGTVFMDGVARPIRFDGDIDVRNVNLTPWIDNPRFAGAITGRARFDLHLPDSGHHKPVGGTYHFTGPSVTTAGYAAQEIDVRGSFAGAKVLIDQGRANAYGTVTTTTGVVDGTIPDHPVRYQFQGRTTHADLRVMPQQLNAPALATNLDVDYKVQGEGTSVKAEALLHPSEVEGAQVADGTRGTLSYDGKHLSYAGDGVVTNVDIQRLGRALKIQSLTAERFRGAVGGQFHVDATGKGLSELVLNASGTMRHSSLFGAQFPEVEFETHFNHAAFDATAKGQFASLDPAEVIGNDTYKATLNGTMNGRVAIPDLRETFTFDTFTFDGQIQLHDAAVRGLSVATASFDGALAKNVVTARKFTFDGPDAKGSVTGSFAFTDQGPSNLTYDISAPDLARLGKLASYPIAGVAHAQGTLTGNRQDLVTAGTAQVGPLRYGESIDVSKAKASYTVHLPDLDVARVKVDAQVDAETTKIAGRDLTSASTHVVYADRQATFNGQVIDGPRTISADGRLVLLEGAQEIHLPKLGLKTEAVTWATNPQAAGEAVLKYDAKSVAIANLDLASGAQRLVVNGTVGVADGVASNLKIEAHDVDLAQAERLTGSPEPRIGGLLTANGTLTGTLAQPNAAGTFSVSQGLVQQVKYDGLAGTVGFDGRRLTLDVRLDQSPGASLTAKGTLPIALFVNRDSADAATLAEPINLDVHSTPVNLALIEGLTGAITNITGTGQVDVTVKNTVKDPQVDGTLRLIDGAFTVAASGAAYNAINGTIRFTPTQVVIESFSARDDENDPLDVRGELAMGPTWGKVGALKLDVQAQRFEVLDNRFGVADVNANLQIEGDPLRPQVRGSVQLHTGRIEADQVLRALTGGPYATESADATAQAGVLSEAPVLPGLVQTRSKPAATEPTAPAPVPSAAAPSSAVPSAPAPSAAVPSSSVPPATEPAVAEAAKVAPTEQAAQQVQAQQQQQAAETAAKSALQTIGPFHGMDLDLHVTIPDDLVLRGRDLKAGANSVGLGNMNITVGGDLRLLKKPGTPVAVVGNINTVRGSYDFHGRRFDILRDGRIAFTGTTPPDPLLDVTASRLIQPSGIEARIRIEGTARRPRLSFSSTPPLDESEVLALIIFNRPLNSLESGQQSSLAALAGSTAAGFVVAPLTESLSRALNLDIFEIQTTTESGGTGGIVTIGQQFGESLFFRFRQQFGSQEISEVILEYQLARFLRLQASTAQGEGVGAANRSLTRRVERAGIDLVFYFSY
jgi:autotransporter translocation and assembly factor TamB